MKVRPTRRTRTFMVRDSHFSIREEVAVDELVDGRLIAWSDLLELQSHPDAPIGPGHACLRFDIACCPGQPKADLQARALIERARRADREAAATQVQRQRRGDGIAEPISHRNPEDDPRAAAPVALAWKEVRRESGKNVLYRGVLVDVPGDPQRGERPHFGGAGDRAAEDQDGQPSALD